MMQRKPPIPPKEDFWLLQIIKIFAFCLPLSLIGTIFLLPLVWRGFEYYSYLSENSKIRIVAMPDYNSIEKQFLQKITEITEQHIVDEQFGVSELARETGMSRSNLLRKVKKLTGVSVSQFIRQIRLQNAKEMLQEGSSTVSEVSYKVGFSSTSYFIKCFREHYGYPPGEAGKHNDLPDEEDGHEDTKLTSPQKKNNKVFFTIIFLIAISIIGYFVVVDSSEKQPEEKSIAVLPFKNDSADSTNVYIVNGLMESILNNLQKIENLRVISRTSVEKYRTQQKTIPEIAHELDVNYLVEGSGQKAGNNILLNIQLIYAKSDKHLWAEQYARETSDIFELQQEVAKKIAGEIEVIITPEEVDRINEIPTKNMVAYDYFLKGLDLLKRRGKEDLQKSIQFFQKAIENDDEFGRAYAGAAMAYYYLDENQMVKNYSDSINYYADKALFYNPQLPQSLIAKALFYMENGEYTLAVPYFEKALEFNPNYDLVFVFLLDLYANKLPDTEKYLEYALRGIKIDVSAYDSTIASYNYLHISNAFIQSGFVEEAEKYINKSLAYYPQNLFAQYVKAYILFAENKDLEQLRNRLKLALEKDTNRYDIMIEIGKICYFLRDFDCAYNYFEKFRSIRQAFNLDVYEGENAKIAYVLEQKGFKDDSDNLFKNYLEYAENDQTIYKHLSLAAYYSYQNEKQRAIEELDKFAENGSFHYWTVIFLEMDPLMDNIKDLPKFKKISRQIEKKFWDRHKKIKKNLEAKDLI